MFLLMRVTKTVALDLETLSEIAEYAEKTNKSFSKAVEELLRRGLKSSD